MYECMNCGGKVIPTIEDNNIGKCESCGFLMPLPTEKNERIINLFNKANRFRINKEFDKAIGVYETILEEDRKQPDAYFGEFLCLYGIEYVEDPISKNKIMTCHKINHKNVFEDAYYKYALEYSSGSKKMHYENEAKKLDTILRDIIDVSNKEQPYDVFISYKDTITGTNERTIDSVKASELYNSLTNMNLRVFYSRVSLENVAGKNYEPYIYGALNSAKVMVVLGSKKEYFEAEWVKNEWSRYLKIIENDPFKLLIPVYFDMSPKDLPVEFGNRQAMDMNSVSFTPDIIHIIKKTCEKENKTVVDTVGLDASKKYIIRAYDLLEDGDFEKALQICNKALDENPGCYEAYLGKILISEKVKSISDYEQRKINDRTFSDNYSKTKNYQEGDENEIMNQIILSLGNDYVRYEKYAPVQEKQEFNRIISSISKKYLEYHNENIIKYEKQLEISKQNKIREQQEEEKRLEDERKKKEQDEKYNKVMKKLKLFKLFYIIGFYLFLIIMFLFVPPFSDLFKNFTKYGDEAMNFILDYYKVLLFILSLGVFGFIYIINRFLNKIKSLGYSVNNEYDVGIILSIINSILFSYSIMLPIMSNDAGFIDFVLCIIIFTVVYFIISFVSKLLFLSISKICLKSKIAFYIISSIILVILFTFTLGVNFTKYYKYEGDLTDFKIEYNVGGEIIEYKVLSKFRVLVYNEYTCKPLTQEQFNEISNLMNANNIYNFGNDECYANKTAEILLGYDGKRANRTIYICDENQYNIIGTNLITLLDRYLKEE